MTSHLIAALLTGSLFIFANSAQAGNLNPDSGVKMAQATTPTGSIESANTRTTPTGTTVPANTRSTLTGTAGNMESANTRTTPTNGAAANAPLGATEKAVPPPVTTNTHVEIKNQPPATNAPAEVNIKMPDVNVTTPAANNNTSSKETVTEHTTILTDKAPPEQPKNDNVMYLVIFGILALLVAAGFMVMMSRRKRI